MNAQAAYELDVHTIVTDAVEEVVRRLENLPPEMRRDALARISAQIGALGIAEAWAVDAERMPPPRVEFPP